jgi:hypothetical protein
MVFVVAFIILILKFDIQLRHTTYKHHIFYIVMDEITRFTSCMCYEACPTNVGKITFCCSDSSQNQDTFVDPNFGHVK